MMGGEILEREGRGGGGGVGRKREGKRKVWVPYPRNCPGLL